MNDLLTVEIPDATKPQYTNGVYVYKGDVIRTTGDEGTDIVVMGFDNNGSLLGWDAGEGTHVQKCLEYVWKTISEEETWEAFWHCIGREARTVLDGTMFRTFVAQAHIVFSEDDNGDGLTPTLCFSWDEFSADMIASPMDMNWCKYRNPESLITHLNNPEENEKFEDICEWLDASKYTREMLDDLIKSIRGLRAVRISDVETLLNNPEMVQ